jgi:pimeloyl-ACP methyl ester carboxylesterase
MTTGTLQATIDRANASGRQPVVFIHGLWLRPESWTPWAERFEAAGYATLTPGWPAEEGEVQGAETIGQVRDHFSRIARSLRRKPVLVGHSFGGLIAQILAGQGLSRATVAISPAPFRGVLPLPLTALRSAWPVLGNPLNAGRRVPLTKAQFRYAFGNALDPQESDRLYAVFHAAAPGKPIFQAAAANFNPWTEARVDTQAPDRGPLLLMSGRMDHTVPPPVVRAAWTLQRRNEAAVTELFQLDGRGHSLTVDAGLGEVADIALAFIERATAEG